MATTKKAAPKVIQTKEVQRSKLSQKDVPSLSLDKSLKVAKAIIENYGGKAATPLQVARALDILPTTGGFRMLTGASVAYGLTQGAYNSEKIEVLPLAIRILKPKLEHDDKKGKIEAFILPRVIKEFIEKYSGSQVPKDNIAKNVLEEMGVPSDKLDYVFNMIIEEGERLGIITGLKDKKYVEIPTDFKTQKRNTDFDEEDDNDTENTYKQNDLKSIDVDSQTKFKNEDATIINDASEQLRLKRVFITHGKNRDFIEPIKKLLKFGELESVVSVDKTSVSVPVPEKVLNDMRSCGAAIIHVEGEMTLIDKDAKEHNILNPNVLIEIGAAMALYGKRFILLVKDGVKLPSNLQGLFEVRYTGDALDGEATIRILEAINDIKNQKLPE